MFNPWKALKLIDLKWEQNAFLTWGVFVFNFINYKTIKYDFYSTRYLNIKLILTKTNYFKPRQKGEDKARCLQQGKIQPFDLMVNNIIGKAGAERW